LSDPGAEEALYDIHSMRTFAGLELGRDAILDETTILNFRHLLERHDLTKAIFAAVAEHLEARGAMLRGGTIVDATLIAASPTKNKQGRCVLQHAKVRHARDQSPQGRNAVRFTRARHDAREALTLRQQQANTSDLEARA
jgi:IS5 family transposase